MKTLKQIGRYARQRSVVRATETNTSKMELKQFEANPGVPASLAASMLHVSRQRVVD